MFFVFVIWSLVTHPSRDAAKEEGHRVNRNPLAKRSKKYGRRTKTKYQEARREAENKNEKPWHSCMKKSKKTSNELPIKTKQNVTKQEAKRKQNKLIHLDITAAENCYMETLKKSGKRKTKKTKIEDRKGKLKLNQQQQTQAQSRKLHRDEERTCPTSAFLGSVSTI